eukprot:COSAG04_NODE_2825_length_3532_cov_1.454413_3_plen_52_part_00
MRIYREAGPQCPATWKEGRIVGLGKKQPTEGTIVLFWANACCLHCPQCLFC